MLQVEDVWMRVLADIPNDARMKSFADYVTTQSIDDALHLQQWNHYGNDGPVPTTIWRGGITV